MKKKVLRETSNTKKNKFQTSMIRPKDVLSSKILHHNLKVLGISIKLLSQIIVDVRRVMTHMFVKRRYYCLNIGL